MQCSKPEVKQRRTEARACVVITKATIPSALGDADVAVALHIVRIDLRLLVAQFLSRLDGLVLHPLGGQLDCLLPIFINVMPLTLLLTKEVLGDAGHIFWADAVDGLPRLQGAYAHYRRSLFKILVILSHLHCFSLLKTSRRSFPSLLACRMDFLERRSASLISHKPAAFCPCFRTASQTSTRAGPPLHETTVAAPLDSPHRDKYARDACGVAFIALRSASGVTCDSVPVFQHNYR
eukprot:5796183-Pleurochrysis_carterae.AAC.1